MKPILTCLMFALLVLLTSSSCDKTVDDAQEPITKELPNPLKVDLTTHEKLMVKSNQDFAFDFFSQIFAQEQNDVNNNFMVSPFSLSMALAMTWNGSSGDTKLSIQKTLGFDNWSDDEINKYFAKLVDTFKKTDPSTKLSIANSIWTNQNVKIFSDFISLNKTYYDATVRSVDFGDFATVDKINQWAKTNTHGLIETVIEQTNPMDLMYLLNAIYFKGVWSSEFDKSKTSLMNFLSQNGSQSKVDMMHQESNFNYAEDEILQLLELPYGNKAFSMMVLLPQDDKELNDVVSVLKEDNYWQNITDKMDTYTVDLFLPKFKIEYSKKLNNVLKNMGMGVAFEPGYANFARMSDQEAYISLLKQDTYISTDEVGTEAAAVTTVGVTITSIPQPPQKVVFRADKPFVYIIREKSTESILFMGIIKSGESIN